MSLQDRILSGDVETTRALPAPTRPCAGPAGAHAEWPGGRWWCSRTGRSSGRSRAAGSTCRKGEASTVMRHEGGRNELIQRTGFIFEDMYNARGEVSGQMVASWVFCASGSKIRANGLRRVIDGKWVIGFKNGESV